MKLLTVLMVTVAWLVIADTDAQSETTSKLNYSFKFGVPEFSQYGEYNRVEIDGLKDYSEMGKPIIPYQPASILLPYKKTYSNVDINIIDPLEIGGEFIIGPGQDPYLYPINDPRDGAIIPPDPTIYSSDAPYPSQPVEIISLQNKKGYRILHINIYPVRYLPASKKIFWWSEIGLEINLADANEPPEYRGLSYDNNAIFKSVDNPEISETYPVIPTPEYIKLPKGIRTSLMKKLENARLSLEKNNVKAAINKLEAFINEVKALRGKKLTEEQADLLIQKIENVISTI